MESSLRERERERARFSWGVNHTICKLYVRLEAKASRSSSVRVWGEIWGSVHNANNELILL